MPEDCTHALQVKARLNPESTIPRYSSEGAAGMDLCTTIPFQLKPGERKLVPTGLRLAIPGGFEGQIRPRSGLALKHGISMVNSPGTIDSDYRGEIGLILINLGTETFEAEIGDRVGQIVFAPIARAEIIVVNELEDSIRGEQGFGSTGLKI